MTLSDQTVEFLRRRLDKAEMRTAVVVDDALDTPTVSSLRDEMFTFWDRIEREESLEDQLESYGISAESEDDMTDEEVKTLWSRRDECGQFIAHANATLFENAKPAFDEVDQIVKSLRKLGLEVDPVGTDYVVQPPVADLVFLDFNLDRSARTPSEMSAQRARKFYDSAEVGANKPFIILMSNLPGVKSQANTFRDQSDLLGGLFDFISKDDLNDSTRFALRVASWTSNTGLRHKIQDFVETLDSTLCERVRDFMKDAKSLTIEDYAFVQALSLQDDGHPLGDYMQWLFSSLLVYKVLEENDKFTDSKEQVNKLVADSQQLSPLFPSTQLAEIYSIAIAEQGLGEIERHPRVTVEQDNLPMLRLGDLLVHKDGRRVYMVATPDCDLQFAPDAKRMPEEGEAVLLVPGVLQPLRERIGQGQIQTELYFHDGEQYRIAWERKKIITIPVAEFLEWCSNKDYSRPSRIRLPYAVKIQQEVIAGFSRAGMPVAPPLHDFVPVEVYCEGADGTWEPLGSVSDPGVNIIYADRDPTFVLTPAALEVLLGAISELIDRYTLYVRDESDRRRKQRLTNKLRALKKCLDEPEELASLLEAKKKLPGSGGSSQLLDNTIVLHRNGDFSNYRNRRHVVCLNIAYD